MIKNHIKEETIRHLPSAGNDKQVFFNDPIMNFSYSVKETEKNKTVTSFTSNLMFLFLSSFFPTFSSSPSPSTTQKVGKFVCESLSLNL